MWRLAKENKVTPFWSNMWNNYLNIMGWSRAMCLNHLLTHKSNTTIPHLRRLRRLHNSRTQHQNKWPLAIAVKNYRFRYGWRKTDKDNGQVPMKFCPCCKFINKILNNCIFIILLALCYLMPSRPRFCMSPQQTKHKQQMK